MAIEAGTFTTYPSIGNRENLLDAIYNISPEDTPVVSALGRAKATATKIEWQTDALAAAADNAQLEGDQYGYTTPTPTVRVGNFCQISRKEVEVSGSQQAISKAGRKDEIGYQMEKKSAEMLTDIERAIVGVNQASVAGAVGVARRSGSMSSWLTTNVSRGAGGANGGYSSGTGLTVAATDGTQRAFAEAQIKTVMQACFTNGGKPRLAVMSPGQKVNFSGFAGIAVNRIDNAPAKGSESQLAILGAADVYKSDFGNLTAMPDIFSRSRDVYLLDPNMAKLAYLRPFVRDTPAKTGDATKRVILTEWTLVVNNEKAHGIIADLT